MTRPGSVLALRLPHRAAPDLPLRRSARVRRRQAGHHHADGLGKTDSLPFNYNDVSRPSDRAEHPAQAGRYGRRPMTRPLPSQRPASSGACSRPLCSCSWAPGRLRRSRPWSHANVRFADSSAVGRQADPDRTRQELTLTGSVFGIYDDNLVEAAPGFVAPPPTRAP